MIIFVANIKDDIDDLIAIEYLYNTCLLKGVVLDGKSIDKERIQYLKDLGIKFYDVIPENTKIICCGGALTKVNDYVKNNHLDLLVANGGFAGTNVVSKENELKKFKNKISVRTYNFNLDVQSALDVLESKNIGNVYLVSKNVCHHEKKHKIRNTQRCIFI